MVLKNCEPRLSYILAELFNICLKESCFPDCWKVSSMLLIFENVEERTTAKNYHHFSLLSVVSKVFEKLVNNRIVDYLEICGLFSDFQYAVRLSRSTASLPTVLCIFFLQRLLFISINLYGHARNTVIMSGLVLLAATWNCWISYENEYVGLSPLNPWLIVEM